MASNADLRVRISVDNDQARRAMTQTSAAAREMGNSLRNITASLAGAFAVRELSQTVDAYLVARGQIKQVTNGAEEAADAWDKLFASAQRAGVGIEASANLFGSIGRSATELEATTADVLKVTQAVQAAGALGATTAAAQAGAIFQLGQAFGNTKIQMGEFNSLLDGLPVLVSAAAEAMEMTRAQLIELVRAGGVESKDLFGGILKAVDGLEARLAEAPKTIGGAMTRISNAWIQLAGKTAESSGAVASAVAVLNGVAANLETALGVVVVGAVGALSVVLGKAAGALREFLVDLGRNAIAEQQALLTTRAHAQVVLSYAQAELAAAQAAVARATGMARLAVVQNSLVPAQRALTQAQQGLNAANAAAGPIISRLQVALGFLGGPIGAITTVLSLGVTAWALWGTSAETAADKARKSIEAAAAVMARLRGEQKYGTGDAAVLRKAVDHQQQLLDEYTKAGVPADPDRSDWYYARKEALESTLAQLKADLAEIESAQPAVAPIKAGRMDAAKARAIVLAVEREMSLPAGSLLALWQVESGGSLDPTFQGPATSRGIALSPFQILPSTGAGLGVDDITKLGFKEQAELAAKYLKSLLGVFGTLSEALAGYNAGPGAVQKHGGVPPYAETREYVRKAMEIRGRYLEETGLPDSDAGRESKDQAERDREQERLREERQRIEDALASARAEVAAATGEDDPAARRAVIEAQFRDTLAALKTDAAGTKLIETLIDVRVAEQELAILEGKWRAAMERMRAAEQSANAKAEQGLITSAAARTEIAAAHATAAAEMARLLPLLEKAAGAIGPDAAARVQAWKDELAGVKGVVNPLASQLETMVSGAFVNMFSSFVTGAQSAKQAFAGMVRSIISGLAQIAAQEIWKSLFSTGFKGLVGFFSPAPGKAAGGYISGPGTGTSDSIPARLSAGEYVVRAAAVRRVGVAYLDALNGLRGAPAVLSDGRIGYASGGYVRGGVGDTYNVSIAVDASGTKIGGDAGQGRDLGRRIEGAVRSVIASERRPGGMLAPVGG